MNKQVDLFGMILPYHCTKCGRAFDSMKNQSKHHATVHRKKPAKTKVTFNLVLENWQMIAVKESVEVVAK